MKRIHSTPPTYLQLGLPNGLFPTSLPIAALRALLFSATCLAYLILLDWISYGKQG